MLAERVKEWTQNWKQQGVEEGLEKGLKQGRQEGRQEGLQEGEAGLLLRLLERRFGPVDEVIRTWVRSADSQTLLIWGEQILTAQMIEKVFEV